MAGSPLTDRATFFSFALPSNAATAARAVSYRSTGSIPAGAPSSSRDRWMISSTRDIIRADSVRMRWINSGASWGFTVPSSSISALPVMTCRGVFSSWDTFAANSRRIRSASACSVTSKASRTVPAGAPSVCMRLRSSWYSLPSRSILSSLCPCPAASSSAALMAWLWSTSRKSCPRQELSVWKIVFAAGFMLTILPSLSSRTSPSFMWEVICTNSSARFFRLCICSDICSRWRCIFLSSGASSS